MAVVPTPPTNVPPAPPAPAARPRWFARRRVRPLVGAAVALVCLLVIGGLGYFIIYPQVNAAYHWRHAQKAIDDYDFAQARADLERCLAAWPDSGETHFVMARTCRRAGDTDEARVHLQEARRLHWVDGQIRLEYLLLQSQTLMTPAAEHALRGYLAEDRPEEPLVLEALTQGCLRGNLLKDAFNWTTVWTKRHPDDWHARLWRGHVFSAAWRYEWAAEEYQKVLDRNADYVPAHLSLANALLSVHRFDEALPHFERFLQAEPGHAYALLGLARCQRAVLPPEAARATLEELCTSHPDFVAGLAFRGKVELESDNPKEALAWFRRAHALDPNDLATNQGLAAALRRLGKEKEARPYERRSEVIDRDQRRLDRLMTEVLTEPKDVALRREIGTTFLDLGQVQEGFNWLISALLTDPNDRATRQALVDCVHRLGNPKLEEQYREALRKLDKGGPAEEP